MQVALIVGVGLAALWLVRLEAPAVRYVLLRALLVICLALPFVQPRIALQRPAVSPAAPAAAVDVSTGLSTGACTGRAGGVAPFDAAVVAAVIGGGALLRLLWIVAGIAGCEGCGVPASSRTLRTIMTSCSG